MIGDPINIIPLNVSFTLHSLLSPPLIEFASQQSRHQHHFDQRKQRLNSNHLTKQQQFT